MRLVRWLVGLGLAGWLVTPPAVWAQVRPYIGFAYPAGGQQGTTVQVRLGGQGLDNLDAALVTGSGVTAKIVEYCRRLNNQELQLLNEQLRELKRATSAVASASAPMMASESSMMMMMAAIETEKTPAGSGLEGTAPKLIARIEKRTREFVQTPACASISSVMIVELTISPEAEPGEREIRLAGLRGVSNPLPFHVGQVQEYSRKPMLTAPLQVLGKEAQALRKRPADEIEERVTVPGTVNGQIASGEINRYRFEARRGQRLVFSTQGRQLVPFIADAVPGWFQPVLALYDAQGKEVAYDDDYQFKPDPVIFYDVPKDGEYVLAIRDSLYRGREDFVYRITIGELPFVTSIFPLGGRVGKPVAVRMEGKNLEGAKWVAPAPDAGAGIHRTAAQRNGFLSNYVPFALDTLPEGFEREPNGDPAHAQLVSLPTIINGRVEKPDDWDVFRFTGKSNDTVVVEVSARRLDSPLDSMIKLTDARGAVIAFNDDCEDVLAGLNTHHADSYLLIKLPADGVYYVHLGDTARHGGPAYAYRLRLSRPQPDFALRVAPSSLSLRSKNSIPVTVYASRREGFTGPIRLSLHDAPAGFAASPITLSGTQAVARLTVRSSLVATEEPVNLTVVGSARIGGTEIVRQAVPAEDRMQAFLWRHLVPARDLKVVVFDPAYELPPKRVARARPPSTSNTNNANAVAPATTTVATNAPAASGSPAPAKPQFSKQQIAGRLRQLKLLFEEGLLTDDFYALKVAECEAAR